MAESQTLILAKFLGKPVPNLVESLKMMNANHDMSEELDFEEAPTHGYSVEDFVKTMDLKNQE